MGISGVFFRFRERKNQWYNREEKYLENALIEQFLKTAFGVLNQHTLQKENDRRQTEELQWRDFDHAYWASRDWQNKENERNGKHRKHLMR